MVQYEVTAELVKASATITINGVSQEVSVDIPIAATITAATLVEAKQQARADVNLQSFILIHQKIAAATLANNQLVKGRLSTDYSIWQSVNITNIQILLE
jgi:hypothetical protein